MLLQMKHTRRDFVRILFVASQAAVAARLLPTDLLAEPAPADGLNFLVFGDWGRKGERDQVEVAAQMAKAAGEANAKFVISVGDNFYENGVTSATDELWRLSFEQVYHAAPLQIPWHVILGNHDYHGNCDAQLEYAKTSPRWKMPARYYLQTHAIAPGVTADFFYLDTTPMVKSYYSNARMRDHVLSQDVPKQIAWFKAALAQSTAQWKIVFGHHPVYSGGGHGNTPELIKSILPLLHEYKVQAYFNGHDHDLQHLLAGEVNLFDTGAGSSFTPTLLTKRSRFAAASSGFTAVGLQADKMAVRMIDNNGKLLYATSVPRTPA
jgi:tartrate-resistant acid phosphatase type 5